MSHWQRGSADRVPQCQRGSAEGGGHTAREAKLRVGAHCQKGSAEGVLSQSRGAEVSHCQRGSAEGVPHCQRNIAVGLQHCWWGCVR